MKTEKIIIKTKNHKYPIIIGNNLLKRLLNILKNHSLNFNQCLLIIDKKVPKKFIRKIKSSLYKKKTTIYLFDSKETNKNIKKLNKILEILLQKNFNRNDCLISIGGGITGDVSGFAASIFKRGLKFINIPTTLLSQVDSSIGGKTGVNNKYGKNLIGSFLQPDLVISDISILNSLPKREIICGYGEILKHSLINNENTFKYLNKNYFKIISLKSPFIEKAIADSCKIKRNIVELDEKEKNLRKILNLGHTFAHAYEAALSYTNKLNHGEAVILGIISSAKFSFENKILNKKDYVEIIRHISCLNMPVNLNYYFKKKNINSIIKYMLSDKKNNSSKINLILIKRIGKVLIDFKFDKAKIKKFIAKELYN